MVCPMRFVLVGFSVVIATFGIFMYNEHTKTDDNNYTFNSGNNASKTITGGGGSASAGPVTVIK